MASQVDIVNLALDHLGITRKITTIGDAVEEARAANRWFDRLRKTLLKYPWDFATRRVDLVADTDPTHVHPAWRYAYTLPATFLKGQGWLPYGYRNLPAEYLIPFEVASAGDGSVRLIYSDFSPGAQDKFVYTLDETDATKFSDHFGDALAAALAVKMATPLRVNDDVFKRVAGIWVTAWADARSQEITDKSEEPVDASWIIARL